MTDPGSPISVSVDTGLCASSGNCAMTAPAVFTQDDQEGTVILLQPHPGLEEKANVEQAEELCPVSAIRVAWADPATRTSGSKQKTQ